MSKYETRARDGLVELNERLLPGKLWGHGARGLVWNPIFALLPALYLVRFEATSGLVSYFWLLAFVLGFPHAGYTALEIRHFFYFDGVADSRTWRQAVFFAAYGLLGGGLAVWYVVRGSSLISQRFGLESYPLMLLLSVGGSVGAVIGLQDVLVMDLLLRPGRVLRAGIRALSHRRWMPLTITLLLSQFLLALAVRSVWNG